MHTPQEIPQLWPITNKRTGKVVAWAPDYETACDLLYTLVEATESDHCDSEWDEMYTDDAPERFAPAPEGSWTTCVETSWFFQDPENEVAEPWDMPHNHKRTETTIHTPYVKFDNAGE